MKPISECKTVVELLEHPSRFCRGAFARTESGEWCFADDSRATSFCVAGAISRVYPTMNADQWYEVVTRLRKALRSITAEFYWWHGYEDSHDHNAVLELVRRAGI